MNKIVSTGPLPDEPARRSFVRTVAGAGRAAAAGGSAAAAAPAGTKVSTTGGAEPGLPFHAWAAMPPMGRKSWDTFGAGVTEAEYLDNARILAEHFPPFGCDTATVVPAWLLLARRDCRTRADLPAGTRKLPSRPMAHGWCVVPDPDETSVRPLFPRPDMRTLTPALLQAFGASAAPRRSKRRIVLSIFAGAVLALTGSSAPAAEPSPGANPVLRDRFTADPAPLVVGDTVYLYVGHDEAKGAEFFRMNEWLCYSSRDLRHWTAHGAIMKPTDFKWATGDAWAAQVVQRNGRFYLYATVQHDDTQPGKAIGVAVADDPLGPFKDARGSALVTDATTPSPYGWNDIDPTVFVDDDGSAWLAWGNPVLYLARLKPNMTELDGPIEKIALPNYTEGPWLSKRKGMYYMTYASMAHQDVWEHLSYATAPSPRGPWTYQGVLTGPTQNSYTIHPGLIDDFKGQSYLFYHNGELTLPDGQTGAGNRRSVTIDYLYFDVDGRMWPVRQSEAGISTPPRPPAGKVPAPADPGRSDPRVAVHQFAQGYPETWPGHPALASVTRPFDQAPDPVGFNRAGGASRLAQTFVPRADIPLGRISLYAGDGHGTDAAHPLRLSLRDVEAGTELLGAGQGLAIAYRPQGAGLLSFDFGAHPPVVLRAGRRYALALQGQKGALTLYLRASRGDVYADGEASLDDRPLKDAQGHPADFAFALYAP